MASKMNNKPTFYRNVNGLPSKQENEKTSSKLEKIAVLDAGAQFGKMIERRIRDLKVETEFLPLEVSASYLEENNFKAIVITGGPISVNDKNALQYDPNIFRTGIPVLGICFGLQLLNKEFGGTIEEMCGREDGQFVITIETTSALFRGLSPRQEVLFTHREGVGRLAKYFRVIAKSGDHIAGIEHESKNLYGLQFHPEAIDLTNCGVEVFKNFIFNIACCSPTFMMQCRIKTCINEIQKNCGSSKVLSLVSGGVDSTVCTALLTKALGPNSVFALHIDNGFMRKNESKEVEKSLKNLGINVTVLNAQHTFYNSVTQLTANDSEFGARKLFSKTLSTTITSEVKRKIIGDTFIQLATEAMKDFKLDPKTTLLAQGTLHPELIGSGAFNTSTKAQCIKIYHNNTDFVRALREKGKVIEPLRDFYKDEVRDLGLKLGLPADIVNRHPFPGPGLAIRVHCADVPFCDNNFADTKLIVTKIVDYSNALSEPDTLLETIKNSISAKEQTFLTDFSQNYDITVTLLPIQCLAAQGDCRSYGYAVALSSDDPVNHEALMKLAKIIPKICHNITRVVLALGGRIKHQFTDITPTFLSLGVLETIREADHVAMKVLRESGHLQSLTQMPVILIPIHFDRDPMLRIPSCQRSVVIRTFITKDFMTGVPAVPGKELPENVILEMEKHIKQIPGISRVLYDLTPKPPATTEWE